MPHLGLAVTVLGINGNAVRLGISAPDVAVYREEVWARLSQEPSARKAGRAQQPGHEVSDAAAVWGQKSKTTTLQGLPSVCQT